MGQWGMDQGIGTSAHDWSHLLGPPGLPPWDEFSDVYFPPPGASGPAQLPHTILALGLLLPSTPSRGLVANFGKARVGVWCASWHLGIGQGGSLSCLASKATAHVAGHLAVVSHAPWIQAPSTSQPRGCNPLETTNCQGVRQWTCGKRKTDFPAPGWGLHFNFVLGPANYTVSPAWSWNHCVWSCVCQAGESQTVERQRIIEKYNK